MIACMSVLPSPQLVLEPHGSVTVFRLLLPGDVDEIQRFSNARCSQIHARVA